MSPEPAALKRRVSSLRHIVSSFVIRQIEADPSICQRDLQKQLNSLFSIPGETPAAPGDSDSLPPHVFVAPWGPAATRRMFVISYGWFGFYGKSGSETVVESYVWSREHGVHLSAGIVPAVFSGVLTQAEKVADFSDPDRCWLLISGVYGGASGRIISGTAAVIEIGPEKAAIVWRTSPVAGNLRAYVPPLSNRWEIEYVDPSRLDTDVTMLDVYQVDYLKHSFHRAIHQPLR